MRILGISSQFHDAAVTVIDDGHIVFAAHAERYSRVKNDPFLNRELISEALSYGKPDVIALHEKAWLKNVRLAASKDWNGVLEPGTETWIKTYYPELKGIPIKSYYHHQTHAAAGVLTSPYDECTVVVIDAVGELDCSSIWHWKDGKLSKISSEKFPNSMGLFYSAITKHVGLKPMEDEYILMGMAAYGGEGWRAYYDLMSKEYFTHKHGTVQAPKLLHTKNLIKGLPPKITMAVTNDQDRYDMAQAAQQILENRISDYVYHAIRKTDSENLVFMGGVALNCVLNSKLFGTGINSMHIMPNPGDAGSSLGAAALCYYEKTKQKVFWDTPYLGYEIPGEYPVDQALESLNNNEIFGIANGRAEFGPRALGNRSLLADPRGGDIKDRLNEIKRRQKFRPFAPVIMEEYVHDYFTMPCTDSPYMQYVAKCKHPDKFPAIVHADGTSRVQTVNRAQHPGLYDLLSKFYEQTKCPMLVNTSLNIKGEPIVNNEADAKAFADHYGVKVHT